MTAELSHINSYTKAFKIHVPIEAYRKSYDKALSKTAKKLSLPGFRKGKVPAELVKQKYHESIHADTIDKLIQDSFHEACHQEHVHPLGNVRVETLNFDDADGLKFDIQFEVTPELSDITYTGLTIEQEKGEITDADIDNAIERIRFDRSMTVELPGGDVAEGLYVKANATQLDDAGEPIPGAEFKDMEIKIGDGQFDKDVEAQLVGMKVGDTKTVTRSYPAEGDTPARSESYTFEIVSLFERQLPELNDEFVASLDDDSLNTVEELKQRLRDNMQRQLDEAAMNSLLQNASKTIVEANDVEIPESLVDNYLDRLVEDLRRQGRGINEEKFRSARRDSASFEIKWQLILDHMLEAEGLRLDDSEESEAAVDAYIDTLGLNEDDIKAYKGNDNIRHSLKNKIVEQRIADFIMDKNTVNTTSLPPNQG